MFPSNPNIGDQFTSSDGRTWEYDGIRWVLIQSGGGGGVGVGGFSHTQTPAANNWAITHNLDHRYVLVQVVSNAGNTVIPDVDYTTKDKVDLIFANPVAGTAIIRR